MYTLQDKICILFAYENVTCQKFFQIYNLFEDENDFAQSFCQSNDAKKILEDHFVKITDSLKNNFVDDIIKEMDKNGIVAVSCFSDRYPAILKDVDGYPYVLFCKGDLSLLETECLAIIGTRKVSSYGRRIAKDFTAVLSERFTIVSGLAYGVDAIAHETTLEYEGKTIAVLGSGLLNVYPATHKGLFDKIVSSGGLIVSEYSLHAEPLAYHFPARNRIVAGISKGLLVCQAPAKSGTNSTVELALAQGKDVFVVPGEIYDLGFSGSNALIKSMQGACVTTPRDILDYYHVSTNAQQKISYQLDFDEQKIVDALTDGQLAFDQLVRKTQLPPATLNFLLANLELNSIIAKLPGNFYRLYGGIE